MTTSIASFSFIHASPFNPIIGSPLPKKVYDLVIEGYFESDVKEKTSSSQKKSTLVG